jgi:hypothetical protein
MSHDHGHGHHPNGCAQCLLKEATSTPTPTGVGASLANLGNHLHPRLVNRNTNLNNLNNHNLNGVGVAGGVGSVGGGVGGVNGVAVGVAKPNLSVATTGGVGLGGRGGTTVNGLVDIMEQLKTNSGARQFGLPSANECDLNGNAVAKKPGIPLTPLVPFASLYSISLILYNLFSSIIIWLIEDDASTLIVVFDLTIQPPTVISATDNFCRMMGYEMVSFSLFLFYHISYSYFIVYVYRFFYLFGT